MGFTRRIVIDRGVLVSTTIRPECIPALAVEGSASINRLNL